MENVRNYHIMAKLSEAGCPNLSRYLIDACFPASVLPNPFCSRAEDGIKTLPIREYSTLVIMASVFQ